MPAYWLGIMAVGVAIALTLWLTLVLRADRKLPDKPRTTPPPREIVGGIFQAWRGGRQVMPDPYETIEHPRGDTDQVTDVNVPEQRKDSLPEQSRPSADRT